MLPTTAAKAGTLPGHPTTAEPMHAARQFALALRQGGLLERTWRLRCELRGQPGGGLHGAVMLGLEGVDTQHADALATRRQLRRIHDRRELHLLGQRRVAFDARHHLIHEPGGSPSSSNCSIRLSAFDPAGVLLLARSYQVAIAATVWPSPCTRKAPATAAGPRRPRAPRPFNPACPAAAEYLDQRQIPATGHGA